MKNFLKIEKNLVFLATGMTKVIKKLSDLSFLSVTISNDKI